MRTTDFYCENKSQALVLCLGGFDAFHNGHRTLIELAKRNKGADEELAVTLFSGEGEILKRKSGEVFTFDERVFLLEGLGADEAIRVDFSDEFSKLSPEDFLNELFNNRLIRRVICGEDFKFGANGAGGTGLLEDYCKKRGAAVDVVPFVTDRSGKKLSTTDVKTLLAKGCVCECAERYGVRYFVRGAVSEGRKVGRLLGFPTANVLIPDGKFAVKEGVYASTVEVDGKKYRAISNFGCAPTFNQGLRLLESHLAGFDGDLYGKTIVVWFDSRIRDIRRFSSEEELSCQLKNDLKVIL